MTTRTPIAAIAAGEPSREDAAKPRPKPIAYTARKAPNRWNGFRAYKRPAVAISPRNERGPGTPGNGSTVGGASLSLVGN
jgi:hypothetical protein